MLLIALCASHVTSQTRLMNLDNAIQSIVNQKYKIPMYVSVSCPIYHLLKYY